MTKDQLVTKLELDTALFALAVSESGIVGGVAVGLAGAAVGLPALIGAVTFAGLTAVAVVAPDVIVPDLEKAESGSDYFNIVAVSSLPISSSISPKNDPFLASRVFARLWETTDIPDSLTEAFGSAASEIENGRKGDKEVVELISYWRDSLARISLPPSSPRTLSGTSRNGRDTGHELSLRPFLGLQPGAGQGQIQDHKATGTSNSGVSQQEIDKASKQFQKQPGEIDQDDKSLLGPDHDQNLAPHEIHSVSVSPDASGNRDGHEVHESDYHPGPERYSGADEGPHREGPIA